MKTILIQGANEREVLAYVNHFKNFDVKTIDNYVFYDGEYEDYEVIISVTGSGVINAAASTMVGIYNFKPDIVINQGTAGAHLPELKIGDILVGEYAVYINKLETSIKSAGEGSNSLEWTPMAKGSNKVPASEELLALVHKLKCAKKLKFGIFGTSDIFTREVDRILYSNSLYGEISEDMESVAVYKTCENAGVPYIGFRIISNNEITDPGRTKEERQAKSSEILPSLAEVVFELIEKFLAQK